MIETGTKAALPPKDDIPDYPDDEKLDVEIIPVAAWKGRENFQAHYHMVFLPRYHCGSHKLEHCDSLKCKVVAMSSRFKRVTAPSEN